MPVLTRITDREREICRLEVGIATRLRNSSYYLTEAKKADELERYSDRFRPTARTRPVLRPADLNKEFFPPTIWDAYFNPRKRPAAGAHPHPRKKKSKVDWSSFGVENASAAAGGGGGGEGDESGGEQQQQDGENNNLEELEDYEGESDDNDYEMNYFDNGEDENDDLGDGGGDPDGGGEDYD
ncbi:hypothetical protein FRB90_005638 [Tulasnella sp. 427]|nr:hypothetical protein FRB90_005638 [Tulasnella sp. 427]